MAISNRRFRLATVVLPLFLLAMSGLARANIIVVNSTNGGSVPAPACTLQDAVVAASTATAVNGCNAGSGNDTIEFSVTGTIATAGGLTLTNNTLSVDGPAGGITIDAGGNNPIFLAFGGSLTLKDLMLTNGFEFFGGGAIRSTGSVTIDDCTFVNNTAGNLALGGNGGAIFAQGGPVTITNSTFVNNTAIESTEGGFGGAIFNDMTQMSITNSTFSGNHAFSGGALFNTLGGTVSLHGTILADSTGGNCGAAVTDDGYNISDDGTCGFSGTSVNNSTTLHLDPLGLQNNGGPTQTIALEPNSEAVDFIPVAACVDQSLPTPLPLTTDQRGFARPDAGNPNFCDAGAYELQASPDFVLNSERVQIARSSQANSDEVNIGLTFTHLPDPTCNAADDALHSGIMVALFAGTCGDMTGPGLSLDLDPFVVHTVSQQSYGTIFQSFPPETVSGRIVALSTPADTCGEWTLNLEVAGLDNAALGLGGSNPFALILTDSDLHGFGCFTITNAIIGNQIPTPTKKVRRGVRR